MRFAGFAGLLLFVAGPARAASEAPLVPDAHIRITGSSLGRSPAIGRFEAIERDTLHFVPAGATHAVAVPLVDVASLEVRTARHPHVLRGLVLGGLLGATLGGALVATHQLGNDVGEELVAGWDGVPPPHHVVSRSPLFVGALSGAALGGALGALNATETWTPAAPPGTRLAIGGALDPVGRVRVSLTLAFQ